MRMAMLHNRQAPGRDFHKHFSLVPARSDTNPPSNPQSAPPLPVSYKTGLKLTLFCGPYTAQIYSFYLRRSNIAKNVT